MAQREPKGFRRYIRAAFIQRWNLLLFFGAMGLAVVSGQADALAPVVMAAELAYLTGLASMPRFRTAIDAKVAAEERGVGRTLTPSAEGTLQRMIESLPSTALRRFLSLRQRCTEMREIAAGVRGQAHSDSGDIAADAMRSSALDRLLFLFLKLLVSQAMLERFLNTTSERELELRLQDVQTRRAEAQTTSDERIVRSLADSEADATLRLDNYRRSMKDAEFVNVELDRIETKIRALVELAVSRQDAEALSVQVTAAADSMKQTEDAVNHLQHLTGLESALEDTPPILQADMARVLGRGTK
jgi:hypothetical protein